MFAFLFAATVLTKPQWTSNIVYAGTIIRPIWQAFWHHCCTAKPCAMSHWHAMARPSRWVIPLLYINLLFIRTIMTYALSFWALELWQQGVFFMFLESWILVVKPVQDGMSLDRIKKFYLRLFRSLLFLSRPIRAHQFGPKEWYPHFAVLVMI